MSDIEDDEPYDDDYEGEDDLDEYDEFDCHMMPDGQCGMAGSEECDFSCPYMRDLRQELRAANLAFDFAKKES